MTTRKEAIESGIANAYDTVMIDKAMDAMTAFRMMDDFVSDGLSCYGFSDVLTEADRKYARSLWNLPVTFED